MMQQQAQQTQSAAFYRAVGQRIRAQRELRSLTQADIATLLGMSQPNYHYFETGQQELHVYELCLIAKRLSVAVTDLLPMRREETR